MRVGRGAEKITQVKNLGADLALNRNDDNYWDQLSEITNQQGVDVVIENVGAATWSDSINSLAKGGRLVTYGRISGRFAETDIRKIFWDQLRIIGTTMANRKEFNQVMELVFKGKLHAVVDKVFPLAEAQKAYQRLQDGQHFGKVIIKISEG